MRLATRLSLSYLGFLLLLGVLVIALAGWQVTRMSRYLNTLRSPAAASDATGLADYLGKNGLNAPMPAEWLQETLKAGGWAQVVDAKGQEVAAAAAPEDRVRSYTPLTLAHLAAYDATRPWHYQIALIQGPDYPAGAVLLVAPTAAATGYPAYTLALRAYFLSGVGMAALAAVLLALLAGFWYARRLARPLVTLSRELKVAAAGDFSHRLPVRGTDEYATLAKAYNHLVEQLHVAAEERAHFEGARRDLVANISHDLRTPLTAIQGFSEAMTAEAVTPEERRRYAGIIAGRIQQLDRLLGDLLELSRLQALPAVKRGPLDLAELVREQVIGLMPEIEQAGIAVEVDLPDRLPAMQGDGRLIRRALQNLLTNAIRHSGAHRITVAVAATDDEVRLTVANDGAPIPAAELPLLFERYYRGTSATAQGGGTGLGLTIVKQIAENHGGHVGVESAAGRETSFWLSLPLSG